MEKGFGLCANCPPAWTYMFVLVFAELLRRQSAREACAVGAVKFDDTSGGQTISHRTPLGGQRIAHYARRPRRSDQRHRSAYPGARAAPPAAISEGHLRNSTRRSPPSQERR